MALFTIVAEFVLVMIVSTVAVYYICDKFGKWGENKKKPRAFSKRQSFSSEKEDDTNTRESRNRPNLKRATESSGRQRRGSSRTTTSSLLSPSVSLQESEDVDNISPQSPECLNLPKSAPHTPGLTCTGSFFHVYVF